MADDIVTRLHEEIDSVKPDVQVLRDLITEIKLLREIAEAAEQYHDVACDPDWCRLCRALNAWEEARRG